MTEAISYLTIASAAYIFSVLFKSWSTGVVMALLVHVTWIGVFGFGTLVTEYAITVWYPVLMMLFALLGYVFATLWNAPALLHAGFLERAYSGTNESGVVRITAITLVWLVFVAVAHLVYELDVAGFPEPWGGVVLCVGLLILYGVFYFFMRREASIFKTGANEAFTYTFWFAVPHIVYSIVYITLDAVLSDTRFYTDEWNLYSSFIVFGAALIVMIIFGAGFLRDAGASTAAFSPMRTTV